VIDLHTTLGDGAPVFGIAICSSPAAAELAGRRGIGCVLIDVQHGGSSSYATQLEALVRGAQVGNAVPLVRISENRASEINKALNAGAAGIFVPRVESAEEAERAVRAGRYPPDGIRGAAPIVRAARYGATDWRTYHRESKKPIIPIIETKLGIDRADEIAGAPGVDGVCLDAFAAAVDLGVEPVSATEGAVGGVGVARAAEEVARACRVHGVIAACVIPDLQSVATWIELGYRLLVVSSDLTLFLGAVRVVKAMADRVPQSLDGTVVASTIEVGS